MDRFVAHCVATAVITAALAAIPTVLAQSSRAATPLAAPFSTPFSAAASTAASTAAPTAAALTADLTDGSVRNSVDAEIEPSTTFLPDTAALADNQPGPGTGAVCADAYQVGSTVYARWHGEIIFSVKQFYSPSCHARYSYAFPWLQFRNKHVSYDIGLAVFDATHDAIDGGVTYVNGIGSPNYWSAPVNVAPGTCTEATIHLFLPDDESDTYTQKACF
jgi:hypothetical protein